LGHSAGDELIMRVSAMIRSLYENSLIFRIGGDEFLIITIGQDKDSFISLSEKSKTQFESEGLAALGYCFYERVDNLTQCIKECDSLMYKHKKQMETQRT
jgi:diguanylate cyclase (GGDEF)-like protein